MTSRLQKIIRSSFADHAVVHTALLDEPRLEQPQAANDTELLEGYEEYLGQPWGHMARLENIFSQILADAYHAHAVK